MYAFLDYFCVSLFNTCSVSELDSGVLKKTKLYYTENKAGSQLNSNKPVLH